MTRGVMKTSNRTIMRLCFSVALLMLLCERNLPAQSQITTGAIQGTVSDASGAVMPGVTVVLRHVATGTERSLLTDNAGRFAAPLLPVGQYDISAELAGFSKSTYSGYVLELGQTLVANFTLKVASVEESVT